MPPRNKIQRLIDTHPLLHDEVAQSDERASTHTPTAVDQDPPRPTPHIDSVKNRKYGTPIVPRTIYKRHLKILHTIMLRVDVAVNIDHSLYAELLKRSRIRA